MSRIRIAPIVEGHGENEAIRPLLTRVWTELLGGEYAEILKPIRRPRSKLVQKDELQKAVQLAHAKLNNSGESTDPCLVLVLVDADEDLPCVLGPQLLDYASEVLPGIPLSCVVANVEYETWFVATAGSLSDYLEIDPEEVIPEDPEGARSGKRWVETHFKGVKYSETVDQPAMTATMDLKQCRERSKSFDKLCRDLEERHLQEQ